LLQGQESTPNRPGKKNPQLAGFERLPELARTTESTTSITFWPSTPQAGLCFGRAREGATQLVRVDWNPSGTWSVRELLGRVEVPAGARPRLAIVPVNIDEAWTLAAFGPGYGGMSVFDRRLALWRPRTTGVSILASTTVDLDRDGQPELIEIGPTAIFLGMAPGFDSERLDDGDREWLGSVSNAVALVPWDLDGDREEDLIVCRADASASVLVGRGRFQFETDALAVVRRSDDAGVELDDLRLAPVGHRQWGVGWAEDAAPWLVVRERESRRLTVRPPFENPDPKLRVLDARILDVDADGRLEVLLLAHRGDRTPELALFRLPEHLTGFLRPIGIAVPVAHAKRLAVGDIDGDGAPDIAVDRVGHGPLVFRNTATEAFSSGAMAVSLEDTGERRNAVASYVELRSGDQLVSRQRWPPLVTRDQPQLWLTLTPEKANSDLSVQVIWTDGNYGKFDFTPGRPLHATRD